MTPLEIAQLFNIVAPHLFALLGAIQQANPEMPYREVLEKAGVKLDAEAVRLLADMAKALEEGAVVKP